MAMTSEETTTSNILPRRDVIYCGACGLPPEYCEYWAPDFRASKCDPWLRKHHPDLFDELSAQRGGASAANKEERIDETKPSKPDKPWTVEERLTAFYQKYVPEKASDVPSLLDKYAGKEDKLFLALTKKYGPEPLDPYYSESDDEDDDDDDDNDEGSAASGKEQSGSDAVGVESSSSPGRKVAGRSKKSGKEIEAVATRVLIRKVAQKKKRNLTVVIGMETVPGLKLKDASKAFSKRFAGSSSVKENDKGGQEIILQGDHMYDVAEMIVDKFGVPESCVWLDIEGDVVPLR